MIWICTHASGKFQYILEAEPHRYKSIVIDPFETNDMYKSIP